VYTEKPIANTLEDGLKIAALEKKYGVSVTVGHSARLMAGIRIIRAMIDKGELGRVAFMEANFSNERALELTRGEVSEIEGLYGESEVDSLVRGLSADQRQAVLAYVVDDCAYSDIAAGLQCSESVVRKRVSRGLARLRLRLEEVR